MRSARQGDVSRLGVFVSRYRRTRMVRKLAGLCQRYLSWYGNVSYDVATNGERFVIETLAAFRPRVLFDVGANVGEWTVIAKQACPTAEVHAFEIAEPTYNQLAARTQSLAGIHCRNIGLSDTAGTVRIHYYKDLPVLTTSADYPHPFDRVEIDATVIAGDAYAAANNIPHIDLLKIDVEGMEGKVLQGFEHMFAGRAIDLVQFEYGRVNIVNRFLLSDFYAFFRKHGFVVGKIYPNYVDFRDYDLADEDFTGPNYLACRAECVDYRRALGGRRPAAGASAG